ncbi:hypothetical protein Tco_1072505, partial [Tanacetum coccineum]
LNGDGREPSGSNTEADSKIDDTVVEQSFVDDQDSVQIGEENFPKGNGAPGSGLEYKKSEHMSLKVYADSDWAKCAVTRRSVSGYCMFLVVVWFHGKATLSKSSVEA